LISAQSSEKLFSFIRVLVIGLSLVLWSTYAFCLGLYKSCGVEQGPEAGEAAGLGEALGKALTRFPDAGEALGKALTRFPVALPLNETFGFIL